jgi:hypothetical protein
MDISFGIEFEFDVIKSDGSKITREFPRGRIPIDTWGFVRKENQGMISLLRNLGFEFEQGNDRSLRFYLPQNRRDE